MCPPKPSAAPVPQLCCVIAVRLPWRIVLRLGGPKCRAKQVRGGVAVPRTHEEIRRGCRHPSPCGRSNRSTPVVSSLAPLRFGLQSLRMVGPAAAIRVQGVVTRRDSMART